MVDFQRPTKTKKVSDDFAAHKARGSKNPGTDYVVGVGTPVFAIGDGTVCSITTTITGAGGRMVWLDLDGGKYFADYLHLSRIDVKPGQKVKKGDQLGLSGASGLGKENGYGAHLHLAVGTSHTHVTPAGNIDFEALIGGGAAPAASANPGGRATLKKGSKGADVVYLQKKIGTAADGDFGPKTHAAVVAFQTSKGLVADGIVGPKTWAAIG